MQEKGHGEAAQSTRIMKHYLHVVPPALRMFSRAKFLRKVSIAKILTGDREIGYLRVIFLRKMLGHLGQPHSGYNNLVICTRQACVTISGFHELEGLREESPKRSREIWISLWLGVAKGVKRSWNLQWEQFFRKIGKGHRFGSPGLKRPPGREFLESSTESPRSLVRSSGKPGGGGP